MNTLPLTVVETLLFLAHWSKFNEFCLLVLVMSAYYDVGDVMMMMVITHQFFAVFYWTAVWKSFWVIFLSLHQG